MVQDFRLAGYGWDVRVYYELTPDECADALSSLQDIGCSDDKLKRARGMLLDGGRNYGVTYSNFKKRSSVVIIGRTTSADEFQNTYDHEKSHLVKQICQALRISPWGEEAEYLAGTVGQKMFVCARLFLCEHCRQRMAG